MGTGYNPRIATDGLVFALDAANPRCYAGTGLTAFDLKGSIVSALVNGTGFSSVNNGTFTFDGSDDYVTSSSDSGIAGANARTLCAWAKFNNISSSVVCGIGNANVDFNLFEIQAFQSRLIGHRFGDIINGTTILSTGIWYFTAYTYDGTTSKLYLNASLEGSINETLTTVNTPFTIGKKGFASNSNMSGSVPQALLYNRALTAAEIRQNYNATKGRYGL
jgi:hypothetical protein